MRRGKKEPANHRPQQPVFNVSHEWSVFPGTLVGGSITEVVGEGFRQDEIAAVAGPKGPDGPDVKHLHAQLTRDPANPVDRNAVAVWAGSHHVGYLPAPLGPQFGAIIDRIHTNLQQPATCRAEVTGGWLSADGDEGHYGVVLDCATPPRIRTSSDPVWDAAMGRIAVTGEQHCQDFLRSMLGTRNRHEFVASLRIVDADSIEVFYGDHRVGQLTRKMSGRYQPLIAYFDGAGWPTTAAARIKPGESKLEVTLCLPKGEDLHQCIVRIS